MEQRVNFADERQVLHCVYCGGPAETIEHVPAKVFLDEPYPDNLPTIRVCKDCNASFSLDEEFVACLIEYLKSKGNIDNITREKIKNIFAKKPNLNTLISKTIDTPVTNKRVENIFVKIAQGHALFEQNEPQEDTTSLFFGKLENLTSEQRHSFEEPPDASLSPEVGSRASQRIIVSPYTALPWIKVQNGIYRYLTFDGGVRMVYSEYIWCEIRW
ncbi:MAG: hypothetical protein ACK42D_01525 [Candidatus Paceibacteria bacterium]